VDNQTSAMFFKTLDLDEDGFLSRSDLNNSAKRLGWSWHEAPLLAVFDLLSIKKPIPKSEFIALVHLIHNDPLGPYGNILFYFIKPGNSVLFPHTNGFKQWVDHCMDHGKKTLVIGGCTLNRCVRISSIETLKKFQNKNLRVVVDLSLSGARIKNYLSSPAFNGLSAVESAAIQMTAEGVQIVRQVELN
jgi:nicotinamidase-related amidase